MTSLERQCAATTKSGSRCKRNAETESDYCWQHENNLLNTLHEVTELPHEINAITSVYNESFLGGNNVIKNILNTEKINILKNWYTSQKFKSDWNDIHKNQYAHIYNVFKNRLPDDSLNVNYVFDIYDDMTIFGKISKDVSVYDKSLFFSELYLLHNSKNIVLNLLNAKKNGDITAKQKLKDYIKDNLPDIKLREGDIIYYGERDYYSIEAFIQKGYSLIKNKDGDWCEFDGPDESDNSPTIPVNINDYPHSKYFCFSLSSFTLPYKKTESVTLVQELKSTAQYGIYKTSDGWSILGLVDSINRYFKNKSHGNVLFAYGGIYEDEIRVFLKENICNLSDDFKVDPGYININSFNRCYAIQRDIDEEVIPFLQELVKTTSKILVQNPLPQIEEYNNTGDNEHLEKLIENEENDRLEERKEEKKQN